MPPYDPGFGDGTRWKYTADSSINGWDRCAGLSWVALPIERGTGSSPWQIALFRHGEYLGTATAEPYGFFPSIEQVNGSEISVIYHWPQEGDANAAPTGQTHAGFRWDAAQQKVIMNGGALVFPVLHEQIGSQPVHQHHHGPAPRGEGPRQGAGVGAVGARPEVAAVHDDEGACRGRAVCLVDVVGPGPVGRARGVDTGTRSEQAVQRVVLGGHAISLPLCRCRPGNEHRYPVTRARCAS